LQKHPLLFCSRRRSSLFRARSPSTATTKKPPRNLAKIPFTFPDAPEGELSLLRAAQMYIDHLNQPEMGLHLLNTMLQHYPETQWMPQVETSMRKAQNQLMRLPTRQPAWRLQLPSAIPARRKRRPSDSGRRTVNPDMHDNGPTH
jgi:hypothetical protein